MAHLKNLFFPTQNIHFVHTAAILTQNSTYTIDYSDRQSKCLSQAPGQKAAQLQKQCCYLRIHNIINNSYSNTLIKAFSSCCFPNPQDILHSHNQHSQLPFITASTLNKHIQNRSRKKHSCFPCEILENCLAAHINLQPCLTHTLCSGWQFWGTELSGGCCSFFFFFLEVLLLPSQYSKNDMLNYRDQIFNKLVQLGTKSKWTNLHKSSEQSVLTSFENLPQLQMPST